VADSDSDVPFGKVFGYFGSITIHLVRHSSAVADSDWYNYSEHSDDS